MKQAEVAGLFGELQSNLAVVSAEPLESEKFRKA